MATDSIARKILSLVGQKYNAPASAALTKEIILTVSISYICVHILYKKFDTKHTKLGPFLDGY
jgi:hypothetical protein